MPDPIEIYVDSVDGRDIRSGRTFAERVQTADKAFSLLPEFWKGRAEIIFVPSREPYPIETDTIYLGTPIGLEASSLVIRAHGDRDRDRYRRIFEFAAVGGTVNEISFRGTFEEDSLMGAAIGRLTPSGDVARAVSIRSNIAIRGRDDRTIILQRPLSPQVRSGERFAVERPGVTLVPTRKLTIISHDARSPNLTLSGIEIAPSPGVELILLNVRASCETCAIYLRADMPASGPAIPSLLTIHSNARIQGGIEAHASREQAGIFIHSNSRFNMVRAVRGGVLGGHLTLENLVVQVSQNGWFIPKSLESKGAPIHILSGGAAIAERSKEGNAFFSGWGTPENKARIRSVITFTSDGGDPDGDGLRLLNGSLNSPLGPINLEIFGCNRDGIRLDAGSWAFFGPSPRTTPNTNGDCGLSTTTGALNGGFGMNVLNASRAVIGMDVSLDGALGQLAFDGFDEASAIPRGWDSIRLARSLSDRGSIVLLNE